MHIAAETRIVTVNPMNPSRMNCIYGIAGAICFLFCSMSRQGNKS